ncbi:hypothetical protein HS7_11690 [Sulfolobales archaeon HS-7]|nr:hypothetical protein HS7_11690 [Sulfolobales archaeon HS-7]
MTKVLFLIMSGDEKCDLGIRVAYTSMKNNRYEDTKVLFFGPAQERVTKLSGDIKQMFDELIKADVVDSACVGIAEAKGIKPQLTQLGLRLSNFGERLSYFVNQGYQIITF